MGQRLARYLGAALAAGVVATTAAAQAPAPQAVKPPAAAPAEPTYPTSEAHYAALKAKAKGGTKHTQQTLPDWSGIWKRAGFNAGYRPDTAPLTPKYKAAYDKKRADIAKGIAWDRLSACLPVGWPRWLADPFVREYIPTPGQTWLIYEQLQEIRRVYTDGRGHTPESVAIPLWEGDSIGFWDGDTLVIHTTHVKAGEYSRGGPDYSFNVSGVERMRKIDDKTITVELTVYDPDSLTKPWRIDYRFQKVDDPEMRVNYNSCEEGNNAIQTPDGSTSFILPGEPGYHDPSTFGIPDVALDSLPK